MGRGPQLGSTSTPAPPLPSVPTPATPDPRHPRPQPSTPTQRGCDGGRLYYDGCACIVLNGEVLAQGSQFSLRDVEVVTATVDLEAVRSMRSTFAARSRQAERQGPSERIPRIEARDFALGASVLPPRAKAAGGKAAGGKAAGGAERKRGLDEAAAHGIPAPTAPTKVRIHTPEEEIGLGPACWLWDYLRRSGAGGYFLPLSGGADSSSTATIVGLMCQQVRGLTGTPTPTPTPTLTRNPDPNPDPNRNPSLNPNPDPGPGPNQVVAAVAAGDEQVLQDVRKVTRLGDDYVPIDPRQLCGLLLHTCRVPPPTPCTLATRARPSPAGLRAQVWVPHRPPWATTTCR